MSKPQKLHAGPPSELTRLKEKWRGLPDDARAFWQELFISKTSQAEIRSTILKRLQINLRFDKQLNQFRDWELEQRKMDIEAERMEEDERRIRERFGPDYPLEKIREEVLKSSYARSLATGDFKSGRLTVQQDLNVEKVALEKRRLDLLEKKAAAFDQLKELREKQRDPNQGLSDSERLKIVDKVDEILGIKKGT